MTSAASEKSSPVDKEIDRRAVWLAAQIVILVVFAIVLMFVFADVSSGSSFQAGFAFSLLIFLCSSIGMWAGLGNWPWRWIPVALVSPLIGFMACFAFGENGPEFHIFCLSIAAVVMLTSLALRHWKGQLQFVTNSEVCTDGLQFEIKDMFVWTTAVAVLLGVGQLVYPVLGDFDGINESRLFELMKIVVLGALIAFCVVVNVWAMLGLQISVIKTIALLVAISAAACVCLFFLFPRDFFFFWIVIGSQLMMTLALVGLRLNKLRFVK